MLTPFFGDDIDKWLQHFSFSSKMTECLKTDMDVGTVDDLKYIYDDPELLKAVEDKTARVQFKKFMDAQALTNPQTAVANVGDEFAVADAVLVTGDPDEHKAKIAKAAAAPRKKKTSKERRDDAMMQELFAHNRKEQADAAAMEARKKAIAELYIQLQHTGSLDMAFLVDCTGSMTKYLESVKTDITTFVAKIHDLHPDVTMRLGFVGYRDHYNEDEQRIVVHPFAEDVASFRSFVGRQQPIRNDDNAEDVFGGLNVVAGLDWQSMTRVLYHIGDDPCHGLEFHDISVSDNYPEGDPHGLEALPLLNAISEQNIKYYFGKITSRTDRMITRFNEIIGNPNFITTTAVNNITVIDVVTKSVATSMSATLSSSGRTGESKVEHRMVILDHEMPSWDEPKREAALVYTMTQPHSVAELLTEVNDRCVKDLPDPTPQLIQMAPSPFAVGGQRAAFYGRLCSTRKGGKEVVFKESLAVDEKYRTKLCYEKFLVCHRAAKFLAEEFNRVSPKGYPTIQYCDASIMQLGTRYPEQPFVIMETMVPGNFEKYNSNTGYCAPCLSDKGTNHQAVQAFSHWTHHVTAGRLMVVDCQGSYDQRNHSFLLTDPAVHAVNLLQYGRTNLGEDGFRKFFATHKCNAICRAMELAMPAAI